MFPRTNKKKRELTGRRQAKEGRKEIGREERMTGSEEGRKLKKSKQYNKTIKEASKFEIGH